MAIKSSQGFNITSQESIDSRLVLTKAEMAALKIAALPTNYIAICKDDGKLYIYNSSNEKLQTTGRFRPIDDLISFTSPAAQAQFEAALANSASMAGLDSRLDAVEGQLDNLALDDIDGTIDGSEVE